MNRTNRWLHYFANLTAVATFFLLIAGGMVTSTDSGLAVPDWPNTYGYFMFSFPWSKMVGGIFYEHGHRMMATLVGLMMTVLALWLWFKEPRRWVRRIGLVGLGAVIAQGVLGGLTVIFLLPTAISVGHACLAQAFFCLAVALAVVTSSWWKQSRVHLLPKEASLIQGLALATTVAVYGQLILGAVMRHINAGLAIPDFPLAFGRLLPPLFTPPILIHFAHRLGALLVTVLTIWTALRIRRWPEMSAVLGGLAILSVVLLVIQIVLGAFTIWTAMAVLITTAHVAVGALILATTLVLTLKSYRLLMLSEKTVQPTRIPFEGRA